jgi:hypothetical protein
MLHDTLDTYDLVVCGVAGPGALPWNLAGHEAVVAVAGNTAETAGVAAGEPDNSLVVVDASGDAERVVGDLFGDIRWAALSARQDAFGYLSPEAVRRAGGSVAVLATGTPEVVAALRAAAGWSGLPCFVLDSDGRPHLQAGRPASASLALAALRSTAVDPVGLPQRDFPCLVALDDTKTRRPTRLLMALLADDDVLLARDHESASADLLERAGFPERAGQLRGLISTWIRQRLWRDNYVPEMVLHDDAHSVAVDRNVASLCEPLLARQAVDEDDVFVLAIAAWLHDWGHASAPYGSLFATDPSDVRNYHGPFSATRIRGLHGIHGVAEGTAKTVALLSGHHQGWTSCDDKAPQLKGVEEAERLKPDTTADINARERTGPLVRSFDQDYYALEGAKSIPEPDQAAQEARLQRAHRQLALIRLADALDIGIHRVPDYRNDLANRRSTLDSYLNSLEDKLQLAAGGQNEHLFQKNPVEVIRGAIAETISRLRDLNEVTEASVGGKFMAHLGHTFRDDGSPKAKDGLDAADKVRADTVAEELKRAVKYIRHVILQANYYGEQAGVRATLPIPMPEADGGELRLAVTVVVNDTESQDEVVLKQGIQAFAQREWGQRVVRVGRPPEPEDPRKRPILDYLKGLGIVIDPDLVEQVGKPGQGKAMPGRVEDVTLLAHVPVQLIRPESAVSASGPAVAPPPQPAESPGQPAGRVKYPDGWGRWFDADHLAPDEAVAEWSAYRGIASDVDGMTLAAVDADGTAKVSGRSWHHADRRLPGASPEARALCLAGEPSAPCLVVQDGDRLLEYAWEDGWGEPATLLRGRVAQAFWWPDGDNNPLILVSADGSVCQGDLETNASVGLPPKAVACLDVLRREGALWAAYVRRNQRQVEVWCDKPGFTRLTWDLRAGRPIDVWWARRFEASELCLVVVTDDDFVPAASRLIDLTTGGWKK